MKGTVEYMPTTQWLDVKDPDNEDQVWRFHVPFLVSSWQCLYGNGCPGMFGTDQKPDEFGCCSHGAYLNSRTDVAKVQGYVDQLTEDDLGPKALAYIRKHGWLRELAPLSKVDPDDPDSCNVKTKVNEGGCVLHNRQKDGGKIGCALHHLAKRQGLTHVDTMPQVCWQLPLAMKHDVDDRGITVSTIYPWDADQWEGADEDGTHDSWLSWWCVDTPDAYANGSRLYRTMEDELIALVGDKVYDTLNDYLRTYNLPASTMPGVLRNEGRPMLPLIVNGK